MIELSAERVNDILQNETPKTEVLPTILRSIYNRYMRLFERYFDDIDALNDDKIAELKKYHDETIGLIMYYYLDIPLDTCVALTKFNGEHVSKLLGADWHKQLSDSYRDFKAENTDSNKSEAALKEEFREHALTEFYESMDYVFRSAFGTGSKTTEKIMGGLSSLLFGSGK